MRVSENVRIEALAKYLRCDIQEIKNAEYVDHLYETKDGKQYLVLDEQEAHDAAIESIQDAYEEIGINMFSSNFQDWITNNAIDSQFFSDALYEEGAYIVDESQSDPSSSGDFENDLLDKLVDANLMCLRDFEYNADDELVVKDDKKQKFEQAKQQFIDYHYAQYEDDMIQWYKDNFGQDEFERFVSNNPQCIDLDKVFEECVSLDGPANSLATYDGAEIELENGLFAYRVE